MSTGPQTIDEYLAPLSGEKRAALEKLRRAIKSAAPKAEECISYRIPAFRLDGRMLVWFGASANHCAFYPGGTVAAYKDELEGYDTSKGTIRFQAGRPLPAALVRKIVKTRIAERAAKAAGKRIGNAGVTTASVRRLAFALPGVEDGTSYGFPALKVGTKFFVRLRDDGAVLVVHLGSFADRDYLLSDEPSVFFTTEHYRDYPIVLIRLARVREPALREILTDAWRRIAPRRVVAQFDGGRTRRSPDLRRNPHS